MSSLEKSPIPNSQNTRYRRKGSSSSAPMARSVNSTSTTSRGLMWVCLLAGVYIFSQTSLIAKVHIELAMNRRHRQTEQLWPHRHPGSFSSNDNGQRLRRPDNDESETFEIESEALPSGSRGIDNTDTSDASGRAFETRTSKTIVSGDGQSEEEGMAACLLIKDDNHLLIEWIAYHYLTLPLRYLVIAVDPDSFSSPLPSLKGGTMQILAYKSCFGMITAS